MTVRTRIAPSPTGEDLHVGTLATALINYAYAKKNNGQFVVRVEDTDRKRFVEGAEAKFLSTLKSFGIEYDEAPDKEGKYGPYRQSERLETYKIYAKELIEKKVAYYCFCSKERLAQLREKQTKEKKVPKYDKYCLHNVKNAEERIAAGEEYVIRLNVPENREVSFNDIIRGKITINTENLDDQVLLKSDGYPTYHLAVVIDDNFMKISHVIRAEEWISSTPKHVLLYEAFGWSLPQFAHVPLLRNPDKSKFSKRKNPVWASWYLEQGILPEAMLNYLALMGWSHPQGKEIFDLDEYIRVLDLKDFSPVGPIFDPVKLAWMNGEYIRKMSDNDLTTRIDEFYKNSYPKDVLERTIPLIKERIKKLTEYKDLCMFFYEKPSKYQVDLKKHKSLIEKMESALVKVKEWKAEEIGKQMQELAVTEGVKNSEFFMVLRVAITGSKISPPLNESMEILGKKECLDRLHVK